MIPVEFIDAHVLQARIGQHGADVDEAHVVLYPQAGAELLPHHLRGRLEPQLLGGALGGRRDEITDDEGQQDERQPDLGQPA